MTTTPKHVVPGRTRVLIHAAPRLLLIVAANALLQALLVVPSPWGTSISAIACALASLVVLTIAGMLAVRALGRQLPPADRTGTALHRAARTVRAHPWGVILTAVGTLALAVVCWLISLLAIAFLPGPLAVAVAWIGIGALACVPMAWWIRLARLP